MKRLSAGIVTPVFKDFKNGKYKVISFYAKKARGLMTRFVIQNRIRDAEDLKDFNGDGYEFDGGFSSVDQWVFTRRLS